MNTNRHEPPCGPDRTPRDENPTEMEIHGYPDGEFRVWVKCGGSILEDRPSAVEDLENWLSLCVDRWRKSDCYTELAVTSVRKQRHTHRRPADPLGYDSLQDPRFPF
jgi:hypothetical protein